MQRPLNMRHVLKILNYFSQTMVMPIQVYKEDDNFIAWDGQHTSIALYLILTKVFGERQTGTMIPVNIYPVKQKLEIRRNFILLNGDAKEKLDAGADLVQIYTGFIYEGPSLVKKINTELLNTIT